MAATDSTPLTLAEFAAGEFRNRRGFARRQIADGQWSADEAEARLRPWAAIALAAGADLPELAEPGVEIYPEPGRQRACPVFAGDFAAPAEWRAELARAARAALYPETTGDRSRRDRDRGAQLVALAIHLGVPGSDLMPRAASAGNAVAVAP